MLNQSHDLSSLVAQFLASGGKVQTVETQRAEPIKSKHHRYEPDAPAHPMTPQVIAMHRNGKQLKDIRVDLRMDHRVIVRILRSEGFEPLENSPRRPPSPDQLREAKALARQGVSQSQAARDLGIGLQKLRSWCRRFNIRFGG